MTAEWLQFVLAAALLFGVVGAAATWAIRNGLNERFGTRRNDEGAGGDR